MARIDTLTNFLTDVADSIRSKTGKSETIACEDFDTEIESISGGGDDKNAYEVETIQEMNAISNPQEDSFCVINNIVENKLGLYQYNNNSWQPIKPILPTGYTQVNCINTTAGQYINTNVVATENTNAEYKISIGSFKQYGPHLLSGQSVIFPMIRTLSGSQFLCQVGSSVLAMKFSYVANKIYKFKCDGTNVYLDDVLKGTIERVEITDTAPLYIGTYAGDPSYNQYSSTLKIFYIKIYDNNTLVRYMIPCFRNSDSKVGMYDIINDVFYVNNGSGNFTYDI